MNVFSRVAIICATRHEYRHVCAALDLGNERVVKGRQISEGEAPGLALVAVFSLPGKAHAAAGTQLAIDELHPDLIVDAGAAGSLDPDLPVGAVVIGVRCFEHDWVELERFQRVADRLTTVTLAAQSECAAPVVDFARHVETALCIVACLGDIASGDRDIDDTPTREALRTALGALACDWETSAVLKTAALCGVPALSFRVISDLADESAHADYRRNLNSALENLGRVLREFVYDGWVQRVLDARE